LQPAHADALLIAEFSTVADKNWLNKSIGFLACSVSLAIAGVEMDRMLLQASHVIAKPGRLR
jgi:hypothetical protein